jgi:undecaprenyl-diphosphatase
MQIYKEIVASPLVLAAVVQGISEAFPVSSSFHVLALRQALGRAADGQALGAAGLEASGLAVEGLAVEGLEVALHMGSLLALCVYFFKFLVDLAKHGLAGLTSQDRSVGLSASLSASLSAFGRLGASTMPAVFVGALCKVFGLDFRTPIETNLPLMAGIGACFGAMLYAVDRWSLGGHLAKSQRFGHWHKAKLPKGVGQDDSDWLGNGFLMHWWRTAPWSHVGVLAMAQAVALVPGVSRLGMCLMAGRLLGYSLGHSARIGFIMAIPVIVASTTLHVASAGAGTLFNPSFLGASLLTAVLNLGSIAIFLRLARFRYATALVALYRAALWAGLILW